VSGGGGGGGGSILIANTDLGDSYQHGDDFDDDGVEDNYDNCPRVPNREQFDGDGDGRGDLCDNCRQQDNADQFDLDGDRKGDVCDNDIDNDGIENGVDNCPKTYNPEELDLDGDGLGDACDSDLDGDGKDNADDPCPAKPNQKGLEEVAFAQEECFPDQDEDGVDDFKDNCPRVSNTNQENMDDDKWGDVCDPDIDNDGIMNPLDNCKELANEDQLDLDRDGVGQACDTNFCFVVHGDADNCLDPNKVFSVYSPSMSTLIGEDGPVNLRLFANRANQAMSYTWTIVKAPNGSSAAIANPKGSVEKSTPYEYHYSNFPSITPDMNGEYVIRVTAQSRFEDPVSREVGKVATFEMRLQAEGESSSNAGGCSATTDESDFSGFALFLLAGIGAIGIRRRRR
jgi:MYXO-CTERM domain-containing protein